MLRKAWVNKSWDRALVWVVKVWLYFNLWHCPLRKLASLADAGVLGFNCFKLVRLGPNEVGTLLGLIIFTFSNWLGYFCFVFMLIVEVSVKIGFDIIRLVVSNTFRCWISFGGFLTWLGLSLFFSNGNCCIIGRERLHREIQLLSALRCSYISQHYCRLNVSCNIVVCGVRPL